MINVAIVFAVMDESILLRTPVNRKITGIYVRLKPTRPIHAIRKENSLAVLYSLQKPIKNRVMRTVLEIFLILELSENVA